jgi:hypothetical protein
MVSESEINCFVVHPFLSIKSVLQGTTYSTAPSTNQRAQGPAQYVHIRIHSATNSFLFHTLVEQYTNQLIVVRTHINAHALFPPLPAATATSQQS